VKAFEPIYDEWMALLIKDAKESYEKSGLRASGDYARQLEGVVKVSTYTDNLKLLGAPHSIFMSDGRRPNKNKTRGQVYSLKQIIEKWIEQKGLSFDDKQGAAWGIAYKIVHEGIKVPNQYNNGKVISSLFTPRRIGSLTSQLGDLLIFDMRSDIKTAFQDFIKK
jgi:hypothetical protein